jgi:hypothetical protein
MRLNACIILLCVSSAFALGQQGQPATGLSDTLAERHISVLVPRAEAGQYFDSWSNLISAADNPAPKKSFKDFGGLGPEAGIPPSEDKYNINPDKFLYVLHVTDWSDETKRNENPGFDLRSSVWYVYRYTGKQFEVIPANREKLPPIYEKSNVILLSISRINVVAGSGMGAPSIEYAAAAIGRTASNIAALEALGSAVLNVTPSKDKGLMAEVIQPTYNYSVQSFSVSAKPLNAPFDVTFTATAKPANAKAGQDANSASSAQGANTTDKGQDTQGSGIASAASNVAYCSPLSDDGKCKFSRTFTVESRQYWNVGVNIVARGPRENKYALSSSEVVTQTHTLHAPIIAALDVSPWAYKLPMDKYPYIQVGVPLSGAAFHMPYFGLAQPLPYIKKWFPISAYGGVVLMKQTFPKTIRVGQTTTTAAFNSDLTTDWPVKAVYGIEVPVSSIINKVKSNVGSGK